MSYLVMIEFQDSDAANAFVQNAVLASQLNYERVGKWLLPNSQCRCGGKKGLKNWSRNNKAHVPVCLICRKPSKFWREGLRARLEHALGRNQLES